MPYVTAGNLTVNNVTDDPPADTAIDNIAKVSTCNDKGYSK